MLHRALPRRPNVPAAVGATALRPGLVAVSCAAALLIWPAACSHAYEIVQVTDDSYLNYMPSMLELPDGSLAIAYERLDSSFENGDIMVTFSDDGAAWSTPTAVVAGTGNERHAALIRLQDGTYQVYYLSDETGGYRIHMADSPDGVYWTPRGIVDLGWTDEDLVNPTVISESDGSLTMSYDVLSDGGYVSHSTDGVAWDDARTQVSTGSINRVARHSDGTYVVSYQRKTGIWYYQIDVFTKTSTDLVNWSAENRVTYTQNSHDSFPIELADGQHALYYATSTGGDPYDLYSRVSPDGVSWSSEESWLPYSGWDTQPHPVRLSSGVIALAWPRGATQASTQVHFALLDPPTGVPDESEENCDDEADGVRRVLRCSPNPFSGQTRLALAPPPGRDATVSVYDVAGRLVCRLIVHEGATEVVWDGRDDRGRRLPSSVYFARMDRPGGSSCTARLVLLN